jgi:hypothetical protein
VRKKINYGKNDAKILRARGWDMPQAIEHLPSKLEAQSSNPRTTKKKKNLQKKPELAGHVYNPS